MCVKYQKDSKIEQIRKGKKKFVAFFVVKFVFSVFVPGWREKSRWGKNIYKRMSANF